MKKKEPLTVFWIFLILVIIGIGSFIHILNKAGSDTQKDGAYDRNQITNILPKDYLQIAESYKGTNFVASMTSRTRDPISSFDYKNKLKLLIYKLPVTGNQLLSKVVDVELADTKLPDDTGYWSFSDNHWLHDELNLFNIQNAGS